jgi:hypothetical protein
MLSDLVSGYLFYNCYVATSRCKDAKILYIYICVYKVYTYIHVDKSVGEQWCVTNCVSTWAVFRCFLFS